MYAKNKNQQTRIFVTVSLEQGNPDILQIASTYYDLAELPLLASEHHHKNDQRRKGKQQNGRHGDGW